MSARGDLSSSLVVERGGVVAGDGDDPGSGTKGAEIHPRNGAAKGKRLLLLPDAIDRGRGLDRLPGQ